jgi:hypothetical protein
MPPSGPNAPSTLSPSSSSPSSSGADLCGNAPIAYSSSRAWRLDDDQVEAAVLALFPGVTVPPLNSPGRDEQGLVAVAEHAVVAGAVVGNLAQMAQSVAEEATRNPTALLACAPGQAERPCVEAFVDRMATSAFRRPLDPGEREALLAVFTVGRADSLAIGLQGVIEAILQSFSFFYRSEIGAGAGPGVRPLSPFELASSLSFFLRGSPPDTELMRAAQDGRLQDAAVLRAHATRLLQDPRSMARATRILLAWLGLGQGLHAELPARTYKEYTPELKASLYEELRRLLGGVIEQGGTLADLVTSKRTFVDKRLAALYGLPYAGGGDGSAFVPAMLAADSHAGVLTRGALLASVSEGQRIVHRGLLVQKSLLCTPIPAPPPDVDTNTGMKPGVTERQLMDMRLAHGTCGACHRAIDPPGLLFEQYDALGRFSATDAAGKPIVVAGEVPGSDLGGPVKDVVDLGRRLGGSRQFASCLVSQVVAYAYGRDIGPGDTCEIGRIVDRVDASGGKFAELLLGIVDSPAFRYRRFAE